MRPPSHGLAVAPLRLLALAYAGAVRLRNRYYDGPRRAVRLPIAVVSVGNLTAGGTGKTPIVAWLARTLVARGRRPAVVSRGYGGTAGRGPLVVSRGDGATCGAEVCGDEPRWLAERLRGVPVIVGADRVRGAVRAGELSCDVVLLDDGFQHRRLARDVDLVLLDASRPFDNGRLLPAGLLREPASSLDRADLLLLTRAESGGLTEARVAELRRHNDRAPIFGIAHRRVGFFDSRGTPAARPDRAVAFCAIADPASFSRDLRAEGVELVEFVSRRDHRRFAAAELADLRRRAERAGAVMLTTEKDLARMPDAQVAGGGVPLRVLRIEARPHEPDRLIGEVLRRIHEADRR